VLDTTRDLWAPGLLDRLSERPRSVVRARAALHGRLRLRDTRLPRVAGGAVR
jgi:hypothetical protein